MSTVAVVGLGSMGSRVAARLVQARHRVLVWNRSPSKALWLAGMGARVASTPAEAASQAEMLITMVSDAAALQAVTEGPAGVAAGASASLLVIEMSTSGQAAVARVASVLPEGTGLVDAPVLGSLDEARAGSLTIFVGGPAAMAERAAPLLSALGTSLHCGDLGAGAAAKLVANAALFSTLCSLGEALVLAGRLGLSDEAAYRVLAATPLAAQAERRRPAIESGHYPPRFPLRLARKDADLIGQACGDGDGGLRLMNAARTWFAEAQQAGLGNQDYTAVLGTILAGPAGGRSQPGTIMPDSRAANDAALARYDGLILDLDGVIWQGGEPIPGAPDGLAAVRANGTRVVFVTNDPSRTPAEVAELLCGIGIPATADDVLTSAAAIVHVVAAEHGAGDARVLVVGPPALHELVRQQQRLQVVATADASTADVVIVGGHEGFDYGELCAATEAIRTGARLYATGRDDLFPAADGLRPATGAILAAIETAGGAPATIIAKPEPVMFRLARAALAGCERIAVVGDHLVTDIAGAKRAGLDAILVLSGVTRPADIATAPFPPDLVLGSMAAFAGSAPQKVPRS
jgi:HAD superfamily hydrolase (TIGR01450 family)